MNQIVHAGFAKMYLMNQYDYIRLASAKRTIKPAAAAFATSKITNSTTRRSIVLQK